MLKVIKELKELKELKSINMLKISKRSKAINISRQRYISGPRGPALNIFSRCGQASS
jgi:hypothetical protein